MGAIQVKRDLPQMRGPAATGGAAAAAADAVAVAGEGGAGVSSAIGGLPAGAADSAVAVAAGVTGGNGAGGFASVQAPEPHSRAAKATAWLESGGRSSKRTEITGSRV